MALQKLVLIATAACIFPLLSAEEEQKPRRRVRIGGIAIGAGYSHSSGYFPYYGYYPRYGYGGLWGLYSPWYDPFYMSWLHPGFYSGFGRAPGMGEVKLRSSRKDADIYLDGAYAGKAEKLRSMWLDPGVYNVEVRSGDQAFKQRIYVLSGKTLEIRPEVVEARREGSRQP